jgi:diaminohydroxyphosphoribosylaminopyrimidine deaminase/5-amino-6-(5-phosphoribosylamino)uracil reductase
VDAGRGITAEASLDEGFMARALELAERGLGMARPNPMVGAILVRDGTVLAEGWHEGPGTPHAELVALRAGGDRARGATLYTTLEPCSHFGRTPPCAPAVVEAGVARVVAGGRDPNPAVDGRGFVTLKMAASLDGKVAARDGSSRWITGEAARLDVHRLRARAGAVVVGAGTVVADDPALTVRLDGYRGRQPLRVVVDSAGRVPRSAALLTDGLAQTVVAASDRTSLNVREAWERAGADVVCLETGDDGSVSLRALAAWLGKREIQEVLVEGGPTLAWRAVESGVIDRFVLYLAPTLVGGAGAPGVLGGPGVTTIAQALPASIRTVERVGEDLKVVADVHGHR